MRIYFQERSLTFASASATTPRVFLPSELKVRSALNSFAKRGDWGDGRSRPSLAHTEEAAPSPPRVTFSRFPVCGSVR